MKIKPDVTTGATIAPITIGANGTGVTVDNSSIKHTAGSLAIKADGVTATHLNSSVAGAGLSGGGGSALAVVVGNGLSTAGDTVNLTADVTTGATVAPTSIGANGIGTAVDNSTIVHTAGIINVKDGGITGTQINTSVAGNGLSGGGGAALAVNVGDGLAISADNVVVDLAVNPGLQFTAGNLDAKVNAAAAMAKDANGLGVILDAAGGLEFNATSGIRLEAAVAGDGLAHTTGVLSVNVGNGLAIDTDNVVIDLATDPGLAFNAGNLEAKVNAAAAMTKGALGLGVILDAAGGLEFNGTSGIRLEAAVAGDGLAHTAGVLSVTAGDGVDIVADAVAVDVTDVIDTAAGLKEDLSNNIQVNLDANGGMEFNAGAIRLKAAVAGDGLDHTTGVLSVDVTDVIDTAAGLTETDNNIQVNLDADGGLEFNAGAIRLEAAVAGDGLAHTAGVLSVTAGDGVDIVADAVAVDVTDFIDTAAGLKETANDIQVNLDVAGGLEFNTGAIRLKAGVAGDGLAHSAGVLSVTAGDGVDIVADAVAVDVTDVIDTNAGLTETDNNIQVSLDANGGLEFNTGAIRLKAAVAGAGLTHTTGVLSVNVGNGLAIAVDTINLVPDVTTGATIAPVTVGANGAGMTVDNVSILHTAGSLTVGSIDCGSFV